MQTKHLDAKGKGQIDYDYQEDVLFFKTKGREYSESIDLDDVVVDIDQEGYITGIQIFEATKLFKLSKEILRNIKQMEFNSKGEGKVITIQLFFISTFRNKVIAQQGQNIIREASSPLTPAEVLCTVAE